MNNFGLGSLASQPNKVKFFISFFPVMKLERKVSKIAY